MYSTKLLFNINQLVLSNIIKLIVNFHTFVNSQLQNYKNKKYLYTSISTYLKQLQIV